jgi:hypothetical protein
MLYTPHPAYTTALKGPSFLAFTGLTCLY